MLAECALRCVSCGVTWVGLWCSPRLAAWCVMSEPLWRVFSAGRGCPPLMLDLGPLARICDASCGQSPLAPGLEAFERGYSVR